MAPDLEVLDGRPSHPHPRPHWDRTPFPAVPGDTGGEGVGETHVHTSAVPVGMEGPWERPRVDCHWGPQGHVEVGDGRVDSFVLRPRPRPRPTRLSGPYIDLDRPGDQFQRRGRGRPTATARETPSPAGASRNGPDGWDSAARPGEPPAHVWGLERRGRNVQGPAPRTCLASKPPVARTRIRRSRPERMSSLTYRPPVSSR